MSSVRNTGPKTSPRPVRRPTVEEQGGAGGASSTAPTSSPIPKARPQGLADGFEAGGAGGVAERDWNGADLDIKGDASLAAELKGQLNASRLGGASAPTSSGASMNPINAEKLAAATTSAVSDLAPSQLKNVDGLGLLDGVQDGQVAMEVPLKAGTYKVGGHNVTVKPGTKATVNVEVQNGKLVPRGKGRGGTAVKIHPPIDGPLFITGNGAYISGKNGQGKLMADVGGWFDKKLGKTGDLGLGSTVRRMTADDGKAKSGGPALPAGMLELDKLKFNAANVKLKDDKIDMGSVKVDVGPGSKVQIKGDGRKAELSGRVNIDGMSVKQDGLDVRAGKGSADVSVTAQRRADGGYDTRARLGNVQANVSKLTAGGKGGPDSDRLALEDVKLRDGQIDVRTSVGPDGKARGTSWRANADVSGRVADSKISIADDKGDAQLKVSADSIDGSVDLSSDSVKLDGKMTGANVELSGLQTSNGDASVDLHHARIKGDARLAVDTKTGQLDAEIKGSEIDVRLDDYKGKSQGVTADMGRTELTGSGTFKVGAKGMSVEGDLRVKGEIDDLQVKGDAGTGEVSLDVARGSTVEGGLRRLSVSDKAGLQLDANVDANVKAEDYNVDLPGVQVKGDASIKGRMDLKVGGGRVQMDGEGVVADVSVEDGKVAPGSNLSLDMAKGSSMKLSLKQARYASDKDGVTIDVGPGSRLEGKLDGGRVKVGDYDVELKKGSTARMDIHSMHVGTDGIPELKGKLEVDAKGAMTADGSATYDKYGAMVKSDGSSGDAKLTIDDVTLKKDGSLRAQGLELEVEGKVGSFTHIQKGTTTVHATEPDEAATLVGDKLAQQRVNRAAKTDRLQPTAEAAATAAPVEAKSPEVKPAEVKPAEVKPADTPEQAKMRGLLDGRSDIKTNQHLINHFYKEGGRDWGKSDRLAREHGSSIDKLVADRKGDPRAALPKPPPAPVEVASAATANETTAKPKAANEGPARVDPSLVQPNAPRVDVGTVDSPPGLHDKADVERLGAAKLAGVGQASGKFDPFEAAKQIKDGKVEFTIPVEGRVGSGLKSADFDEGTKLKVTAEVKDGKIVRDKLKAEFSKSGDAVGWVTAKGAYLDDDNQLRVKLGGMYDFSIADMSGEGKGAPSIGKFVDGIQGLTSGGGAKKSDKPSAFKLDQSRISVKDASFKEGELNLPFGTLRPGENTRLSMEGSLDKATISGKVDIDQLDIGERNLAIKNARGTADLRVDYEKVETGHRVRTRLDNLDLEVDDTVYTSGGKYIHLDDGKIKGGSVDIDNHIAPDGKTTPNVTVDLPSLDGNLHSARLNASKGRDSRLEIGRTGFNGHLRLENGDVALVKGDVKSLDASVHDVELKTAEGLVRVDGARLKGAGYIDATPERVLAKDGDVTLDAVIDRTQVQLHKLGLPVEKTMLADGRTHVTMQLKDFDRLEYAQEPEGEGKRTRFTVEGGDARVTSKVSDIVGRFVVP
jgi:major membrane immunogen (membrane-anchored lipoprotein)